MAYKPTGGQNYRLGASIGSTDTSILLSSFTEPVSGTPYTMTVIGSDIVYGTISPQSDNSEFISFSGITQNVDGTATLTGVVRGLKRSQPYDSSATFQLPHAGQSIFILSDAPQVFVQYAAKGNDETVTGQWSFPVPTTADSVATKGYVDGIAIAGAPDASTTVKGISKLSTAPGVVLGTCTITIASPAVVTLNSHGLITGDSIKFTTSGALPTGITAGNTYYVIATGLTTNTFEFSVASGGSAVNTSGSQSGTQTLTKVTPTAVSDTDPRLPTQGENDALAGGGSFGTPSTSNKFLTENYLNNGTLVRFGGTGVDGALNVTSGTTTIDLGGNSVVTKNYTSINVSNGATLTFSNPHTKGTIIRLKSQGAVTIAGTLNASGMGGQGGASTTASSGNNGNIGNGILEGTSIAGIAGTAVGGGTAGVGFTYPSKAIYTKAAIQAVTKGIYVYCGSGGGSGSASVNAATPFGTGGKGGDGGAGVYIECAGALIFSGTINVSGTNGGQGLTSTFSGSGGGGGSAGSLVILANVITTNSGSVLATGGNGGGNTAGANPASAALGGGGAGSWTSAGASGGTGAGTNAPGAGAGASGAGNNGGSLVSGGTGGSTESEYIGVNTELF